MTTITPADWLAVAAVLERGWTQGITKDAAGNYVNAFDPAASAWNLLSAVAVSAPDGKWAPMFAALANQCGQALTTWNDTPGRTQAEVVALVRGMAGDA